MKVHRAYKVELDPNNKQRSAFLRAAGCARWAYNWGLRKKIEAYTARKAAISSGTVKADAPKVPTAMDLHKELVKLKKLPVDQGGVPWMYESSKAAPQEALRNLDKAFENFFRKCKSGTKGPKGFPKFKSRKNGVGGFGFSAVAITPTHINIPRVGKLKLKERGYLPTEADKTVHILGATVSDRAGRLFVSVRVEQEIPDPKDLSHLPVVGVDVGIKTLATCSDGTTFENPKALTDSLSRLKRLQQSVSRKVKGSSNSRKAKEKVAQLHFRISNIRKDGLHKASSAITKSASVIVLEDLNVTGMLKNRRLSRAVADTSMSELHQQIVYKAGWLDVRVVVADRWFPSSKQCSSCGNIKTELMLSEREYVCDACGVVVDRDVNAAMNLRNLAGSSSVTACGEGSSGLSLKIRTKLTSLKQEPNTNQGLSLIGSV